MSIINDAIQDEIKLENIENSAAPELSEDLTREAYSEQKNFDIIRFLKTPTGEGSIEDYIDHPLNIDGSKGIAQILRGFTGIAGDLKLAMLDIMLGFINAIKDKKVKSENPASLENLLK